MPAAHAKINYYKAPITYFAMAFVTLATLKLAGVISWSWWLVTLPLWIPIPVAIIVGTFRGVVEYVALKRRGY